MTSDSLRDEVADFFERFVRAFVSFTGKEVAQLYTVPTIAVRGDGSIECLLSRHQVETFFQTALDRYHADGCRRARFHELEVVPLGGRSAVGTVTWKLLSDDDRVVRTWRQSYNLLRVEDTWRVVASTFHASNP